MSKQPKFTIIDCIEKEVYQLPGFYAVKGDERVRLATGSAHEKIMWKKRGYAIEEIKNPLIRTYKFGEAKVFSLPPKPPTL